MTSVFMRLQLSLEFMVVFSFVLIVFLFMFAIIANDKAASGNQQTFSQLQLVAQSVGIALTQAFAMMANMNRKTISTKRFVIKMQKF